MADLRPLRTYIIVHHKTCEAMGVEAASPEAAKREGADHMGCPLNEVEAIDATDSPDLLALVDQVLAKIAKKH